MHSSAVGGSAAGEQRRRPPRARPRSCCRGSRRRARREVQAGVGVPGQALASRARRLAERRRARGGEAADVVVDQAVGEDRERRWPRPSTCSATARAPPRSSIRTTGSPGGAVMSTRTIGSRRLDRREDRGMLLREREHDHAVDRTAAHRGQRARAPLGGTGSSVSPTSASSTAEAMPRRNSTAPGSSNAYESFSVNSTPIAPARPVAAMPQAGPGPRTRPARPRRAPAAACRPTPARARCRRTRPSSARRPRRGRRRAAWGAAGHLVNRSTRSLPFGLWIDSQPSPAATALARSRRSSPGNGVLFASLFSRLPEVQARLGLDEGTLGLALLAAPVGPSPPCCWPVRWSRALGPGASARSAPRRRRRPRPAALASSLLACARAVALGAASGLLDVR